TAFERLLLAHSAKSIKRAFLARWSVSVELTDQSARVEALQVYSCNSRYVGSDGFGHVHHAICEGADRVDTLTDRVLQVVLLSDDNGTADALQLSACETHAPTRRRRMKFKHIHGDVGIY